MSPLYFTVGPSQNHPNYRSYFLEALDLQLGSTYHRSEAFRNIYRYTDEQLRHLLQLTPEHSIYFTGSGSEIWERMLLNLCHHRSHHLINGAFSRRFFEYSLALGKQASFSEIPRCVGFSANTTIIPDDTELICLTQNETSTGAFIPDVELPLFKSQHPEALLCADLVSVAPMSNPDFRFIDTAFFSVQKAFGMAPGLGVWLANETCHSKAKHLQQVGVTVGAHHTLLSFEKNYQQWETPSTPNTIAIYILGRIAEWMNRSGPDTLRKQSLEKAAALYSFAEHSSIFNSLVTDLRHRSPTVIVLQCGPYSQRVREFLQEKGFIVSPGYPSDDEIRIGNFPATTLEQCEELIDHLRQFESLV